MTMPVTLNFVCIKLHSRNRIWLPVSLLFFFLSFLPTLIFNTLFDFFFFEGGGWEPCMLAHLIIIKKKRKKTLLITLKPLFCFGFSLTKRAKPQVIKSVAIPSAVFFFFVLLLRSSITFFFFLSYSRKRIFKTERKDAAALFDCALICFRMKKVAFSPSGFFPRTFTRCSFFFLFLNP